MPQQVVELPPLRALSELRQLVQKLGLAAAQVEQGELATLELLIQIPVQEAALWGAAPALLVAQKPWLAQIPALSAAARLEWSLPEVSPPAA